MEKKKQEELWEFDTDCNDDNVALKYHQENYYIIAPNGEKQYKFIVNHNTSSCGSIQLRDMVKTVILPLRDIPKEFRQNVLEDIIYEYNDYNNIFFIDREDGGLENFFGDLGFKKVHSYGNTNTYNVVNFWVYDKLTIDEVEELEQQENDYDD